MKFEMLPTMLVPAMKWLGSEGRNLTFRVCVAPQSASPLRERLEKNTRPTGER